MLLLWIQGFWIGRYSSRETDFRFIYWTPQG